MKKILNKISIVFALGVFASSCIKEKYTHPYDEANLARPIVELPNSPTNKINTASVDGSIAFFEIDLDELRIAPRSQYSGDITVVLKQDPVAAQQFIAARPTPVPPAPPLTPIAVLPNAAWSIVKTNYTLNAGNKSERVKIKINTALIPAGRVALGLSIQSANGAEISGLYKSVVVELKAKSPYEGTYLASGTRTSFNGATVGSGIFGTFNISGTKDFITIDVSTIDGIMADLASVPFYYSLKVNPSTNAVTVLQSIANPLDTPGTVGNNGTCTYNPATRTFTLNYFYFNSLGNLRHITETLVRQ
jgi:Domain of unknown function (DUF1735)